jgi:glucose/arabinose dehydrogenase
MLVAKAIILLVLILSGTTTAVFAVPTGVMPVIEDPDFVVERFAHAGSSPTTMAFMGNDILLLQKNDGKVRLIHDGILQERPVLDVSVASAGEQGMLGIATVDSAVYLYFSESSTDGGKALGKRVYRYEWNGLELVNPVLLRDLNATQFYHNGGAMATGHDGSVYLVVGDAGRYGLLQNNRWGGYYADTSVIMRIDQEEPYYAIGVRNSFGLAFDPVTGRLWDTENGDDEFDEINLVEPGFNSGWIVVMGPATEDQLSELPQQDGYVYSDPEFSWQAPVAPTALTFVDSEPLAKFGNSLLVADCNYGNLYRFTLNENRDGFVFSGPELSDNVVNTGESMNEIVFGSNFGCITDLEIGPDGLLYITSLSEGTIFRILPRSMAAANVQTVSADVSMIYYFVAGAAAAGITFYAIRARMNTKRTVPL